MFLPSEDAVIEWAYGGGVLGEGHDDHLTNTSILTVLNEAALEINNKVCAVNAICIC